MNSGVVFVLGPIFYCNTQLLYMNVTGIFLTNEQWMANSSGLHLPNKSPIWFHPKILFVTKSLRPFIVMENNDIKNHLKFHRSLLPKNGLPCTKSHIIFEYTLWGFYFNTYDYGYLVWKLYNTAFFCISILWNLEKHHIFCRSWSQWNLHSDM